MWRLNCKTLAVLIVAILACQFTLSGRAAALSLKSTAHCLGNIQDTSGNVVVNLGTVSAYTALFPQDQSHQNQCVADVSTAASAWLSNAGQMCHAFFTAKSSNLIFYNKLGSLAWRDSGTATTASSYNYPASCYGLSGYVFPSFYVSTLIYTPPGCTPSTSPTGYKCDSGSSVMYTSGSSAGSTTSIENSIGTTQELTATLSTKVTELLPDKTSSTSTSSFGVSGGISQTSTTGSSVTILNAISDTETWPKSGPAGLDGINHDYDLFFILLNPAVAMTGWHDPIAGQNHVQWSLGTKNSEPARTQHVQVSHLRCALAGIGPRPGGTGNGGGNYDPTGSCSANPFLQMPGPALADSNNGWLPGLTYDDYKQILAQDLFWNASSSNPVVIPLSRFVAQGLDYTYEQAIGPAGTSCVGDSHAITISYNATNTSTTATTSNASMTMSAGFPVGPAMLDLKSTTSFTWTNKTTNSLTNANNQSATGTVLCSSVNWPGPNYVTAFYDTVYGTILFALDDGSGEVDLLRGTITDADGDLVPQEPLQLVVGNNTYQTFSHNNGSFLFHLPAGQASTGVTTGTLSVGSTGAISKPVSIGPQATATAAIPTPPPVLSVALGTAPGPSTPVLPTERMAAPAAAAAAPAPVYIAVTNRSVFATAKNVKVTSIQATPKTGSPLVYSGTLPFTLPGGTALRAGSTANFPLTFNNAAEPLSSLTVTVEADNLAPFSTVLMRSFVVGPGGPSNPVGPAQ